MSLFADTVHKIIDKRLQGMTPIIHGYIPQGGYNPDHHMATVRIPNPHAGVQPGGAGVSPYLELYAVPLPRSVTYDIFQAVASLFTNVGNGVDGRGVLVGFKGGNLSYPYVISFTQHQQTNKETRGTPDRQPTTAAKVSATAATPQLPSLVSAPASPPVGPIAPLVVPGSGPAQAMPSLLTNGIDTVISHQSTTKVLQP